MNFSFRSLFLMALIKVAIAVISIVVECLRKAQDGYDSDLPDFFGPS